MIKACFEIFGLFWLAIAILCGIWFSIQIFVDAFRYEKWLAVLGLFFLSVDMVLIAVWCSIIVNKLN